jgi:hypothetical protein
MMMGRQHAIIGQTLLADWESRLTWPTRLIHA